MKKEEKLQITMISFYIKCKKRDKLINYLARKKIFCQIHYPYSLNKLPPIIKMIKNTKLKNSERWANECLSLPMDPKLSISNVRRITKEIKKFFTN